MGIFDRIRNYCSLAFTPRPTSPIGAIGNFFWLITGGIALAIIYIVAALAFAATIVGIPFAIQALKMAKLSLSPFGTVVVPSEYHSVWKTGFNLLWFLLFGWIVALIHLVIGMILMCTVVGIPLAIEHFRLIGYAISPFGRTMIVRE